MALFDGLRVLSETTWLAGREHSTRLLVEVDAAFERIGRTPTELTGLVVARGPGSFHVALYDALAALDPETLDLRAQIA